jgi:FkbM family methyltransferase
MKESNPYKKHVAKAQCPPLADIYLETFGVKDDGWFVEVGAFNGINWSATYGLAKMGWHGLLFEPNKEPYNECSRLYQHNNKVRVVNCAILDYIGETKLYLGGSLSTTSKTRVEVYQDVWWAKSSRLSLDRHATVNVSTLDHMLEKHKVPIGFEMLVIDVEGAEAQVLNGMDIDKYQPQLMMVETHEELEDERLNRTAVAVESLLSHYGYEKVYANYINTVYRREQ